MKTIHKLFEEHSIQASLPRMNILTPQKEKQVNQQNGRIPRIC
jgi:hypothetical protein